MLRSSFASFNTARLAIQANQSALAIVGQNIANVKTSGYTRQRLDQVSLNTRGLTSIYESPNGAHIGSGVMVTGVSQIRDPFLDSRYRLEMSNLGGIDKKVAILDKLGVIFDEADRSALDDQFGDFAKQLRALQANSNDDATDSMCRSSAQTITDLFRQYSSQISEVKTDLVNSTTEDVKDINDTLKKIEKLTTSIKESQVHGNPALELQDERNLAIDQLATYANIKVTHNTDLTMTGASVDILKIELMGSANSPISLIDDTHPAAQFSLVSPNQGYNQDYTMAITDSRGVTLSQVTSDKGSFKTSLSMLNNGGEFDTPQSSSRGIAYYEGVLDGLAEKFATEFNKLNAPVQQADGTFLGGNLFASTDGSAKITAANITLSSGWLNGTVHLLSSRTPDAPSGENSNIGNMISAMDKKQEFKTPAGTISFNGTFQECFTNMVNVEAIDQKSATT
ncbi:MAG: flagellar hook-associated protein FlgK, partial [Hungatella sp.]